MVERHSAFPSSAAPAPCRAHCPPYRAARSNVRPLQLKIQFPTSQTAQWKLVSNGTFGGEAGARQGKGPKQARKLVIMVDDMIVGTVTVESGAEPAWFDVPFSDRQIGPRKLRAFVERGDEKRGVRFLEVSRGK